MSQSSVKNAFIEGPIAKTLLLTSLAMIPGTLAMSIFNVVDTFFVSRLGNNALSAMGYCFPVMMFVNCVYHGFTTGIMTLLSHAIGKDDRAEMARILGLGTLLIAVISVFLGGFGALVCRPIYAQFIETPEVLELTYQFMLIWFLGNITISLCLLSNKILLALGLTKHASFWTVLGILINIALEPMFIFGWGPIPRMEMYGASLATVIAQGIAPLGSFIIIQRHCGFLNKTGFNFAFLGQCWKRLTLFSLPAMLSMLIMPVGGLVMVWIASHFGDVTVAGIAAAQRLEVIAFIIPMSLGVSLAPMIAQNYAAKRFDRVDAIRAFSIKFAFVFLMIAAGIMTLLAESLVGWFTQDPVTLRIGTVCLQLVAWSFAAQEIFRFCSFVYNSCNRPLMSAVFNLVRMFCLAIPFSMLALVFHDVNWIFYGRLIAETTATLLIWHTSRHLVRRFLRDGSDTKFECEASSLASPK